MKTTMRVGRGGEDTHTLVEGRLKQNWVNIKTPMNWGFPSVTKQHSEDDDELQLKLNLPPPLRNNKGAESLNNRW